MFGDSLSRLVFWIKFRAHVFDITNLELRKYLFICNEKNLLKNWKHPVLFLAQKDPKVTRNEVSIGFYRQIFKKNDPILKKMGNFKEKKPSPSLKNIKKTYIASKYCRNAVIENQSYFGWKSVFGYR